MKSNASEAQKVVNLINPIAMGAGTTTGTGIDCQGFEEALIVLAAGVVPSNGTLDVKIQESDSLGSGYSDITLAAFVQVTAATQSLSYVGRLNLVGRKRYIRAIAVGVNQTIPLYVMAVLSAPKTAPVSQINTAAFNL